MLDEAARKVGYEKFVSSIVDYYKTHKGQRDLEFHDIFLNTEDESE